MWNCRVRINLRITELGKPGLIFNFVARRNCEQKFKRYSGQTINNQEPLKRPDSSCGYCFNLSASLRSTLAYDSISFWLFRLGWNLEDSICLTKIFFVPWRLPFVPSETTQKRELGYIYYSVKTRIFSDTKEK